MLCENLLETQNASLGLTIAVRLMNLDAPRSEEELKSELLAHALDCHECLAVVLFQEDSLDQAGCDVYRRMFHDATEELKRQALVNPSDHLTEDLIHSFFWDQLSEEQLMAIAEHLESCEECRQVLHNRQDFHLGTKAAIEAQRDQRGGTPALIGAIGVTGPDLDLQLTSLKAGRRTSH